MPMQTSQRARELERLYKSRQAASANPPPTERVPSSSYSLSPDNGKKPRPLSFVPGPQGEVLNTHSEPVYSESMNPRFRNPFEDRSTSLNSRYSPSLRSTEQTDSPSYNPSVRSIEQTDTYYNQHHSDPRNGSNTMPTGSGSSEQPSTQAFPLNDIDYESDPMAVAQELSNLQAIRRMSMDVNNTMDPDLPSFNQSFGVPSLAPSHHSDEEDPSRLFWVPARLHPELAPKEFKTFIQEKVRTIKRSSLSEQPLMTESAGSLRRRKSMLSRQIDNPTGYEDGSTRLKRKESQGGQLANNVNLHELEELVSDPTGLVRRMSVDRTSMDSGSDIMGPEDMPILPGKPGLQSLKRSTRTTYRKQGSLKKAGGRRQLNKLDENGEPSYSPSGAPQLPDHPQLQDLAEFAEVHFGLTRVNTEPVFSSKNVENFSRPSRRPSGQHGHGPSRSATFDNSFDHTPQQIEHPTTREDPLQSRYALNGRPNHHPQPIPQIVETPPEPRPQSHDSSLTSERIDQHMQTARNAPPRPAAQAPQRTQSMPQRSQGNSHRPGNITLDDIASHPNILPQSASRTDSLSLIPTYAEEKESGPKKLDKKAKSKEDGSRKTSWNWFSSGNNDEKERERREKEEKELAKRSKSRLQKSGEKQQFHDNTRLDVLQQSIDGSKGRESTVFDRQSIQVDDSSNKKRPTTSDSKKEKDGFLSSIFGGSKRKSEREDKPKGKAGAFASRGLSPDPPHGYKPLRPDVDYNWTRFSILEERAIYRMAHMKLANPRRELLSQVLLSNFMYSYLAKVQQMHPQIQIPQSAAQKQQARQSKQRDEDERKTQEQTQQMMIQQQQTQQAVGEEYDIYQRYHQEQSAYEDEGAEAEAAVLENHRQQHQPSSQQQQQQQYSIPQRGSQSQQQHQQYGVNGGNGFYEYDRNGYSGGGYGSQQQLQEWYEQPQAGGRQQQQQQQQSKGGTPWG